MIYNLTNPAPINFRTPKKQLCLFLDEYIILISAREDDEEWSKVEQLGKSEMSTLVQPLSAEQTFWKNILKNTFWKIHYEKYSLRKVRCQRWSRASEQKPTYSYCYCHWHYWLPHLCKRRWWGMKQGSAEKWDVSVGRADIQLLFLSLTLLTATLVSSTEADIHCYRYSYNCYSLNSFCYWHWRCSHWHIWDLQFSN